MTTGTQIIRCTCNHPYQDSLYGAGNRVGNIQRTGMIRCTVCGTVGGTKSTVVAKAPTTSTPAPAPVEKESKKDDNKKERRSSKFKTKEKKPSSKKDKASSKPKGIRSMKGGKR